MNQYIKKTRAIEYAVTTIVLCFLLLLGPLQVFHQNYLVQSSEITASVSSPVNAEHNAAQVFVAKGNYLRAVSIAVKGNILGDDILFRIYDSENQVICDKIVIADMQGEEGWLRIPVGVEVTDGNIYFYQVEGRRDHMRLALEETALNPGTLNGNFLYGGALEEGRNVITRYEYTGQLPVSVRYGVIGGLVALAMAVILLMELLERKKAGFGEVRVQTVFRIVLNPLIVIGTILSLASVYPLRLFGTGAGNIIFYWIGILMLAVTLLYAVNYKRDHSKALISPAMVKDRWQDWLQSLCYAGALWGSCAYMNALYDAAQREAACVILFYLALSVIVISRRKEIFHPVSLAGLVIFAALAWLHYRNAMAAGPGEEALQLAGKEAYVIVTGGYAAVISVLLLLRRQTGRLRIPYGILLTVFFALLIALRNTRPWPLMLVAVCAVIYLRYSAWGKKERYLPNLCNGILLHFVFSCFYVLQHRPYHSYVMNRYGFVFHTVTIAAVYLTVVISAALVKLFAVYQETGSLRAAWKEISLFGVSFSYLIFTLSRTGYVAAVAMAFFMLLLATLVCDGQKWKGLLKRAGIMAVSVLWCLPITFTATRLLPAAVSDPRHFEIESFTGEISPGERWDSDYYINISRFVKLFGNKILGMDLEVYTDSPNSISQEEDSAFASIPLVSQSFLVASANAVPDGIGETGEKSSIESYSNGRFDIWRAYREYWNLTGHEEMGVPLIGGEIAVHAHNMYLQAVHDHGLPGGIAFTILIAASIIFSVLDFVKKHKHNMYTALPAALTVAFAVAGIVEWIFHPCNPMGLTVFLSLAPLVFRSRKVQAVNKANGRNADCIAGDTTDTDRIEKQEGSL